MARIRTIKPSFFRHGGLYDAEKETRLPIRVAYAGLWTACDKEGRFRWNPRELKLDCLPHDELDFSRVLDALTTRGFIVKYTVDGITYGCIPSWKDHQVVNNRETPSLFPEPPDNIEQLTRDPRVHDASTTRGENCQGEGKGKEEGKEGKGSIGLVAVAPAKPDPRGTRLPDDWTPSPALLAWAESEAIPNVQRQTDRFRDYWRGRAGKDARKSDWDATWRNWMRKSAEGSGKATKSPSGPENGFAALYRENYGK